MYTTLYLPDWGKFIQTWVDRPWGEYPEAAEDAGAKSSTNGTIEVSPSSANSTCW